MAIVVGVFSSTVLIHLQFDSFIARIHSFVHIIICVILTLINVLY